MYNKDTFRIRDRFDMMYSSLSGVILDDCKFAGQKVYAPYFYERYLNNNYDDILNDEYIFIVTNKERDTWPELGKATTVGLCIDDCNYVSVVAYD